MRTLLPTLLGLACLTNLMTPSIVRGDDGDLDTTFDGGSRTIEWSDPAQATELELLPSGDALVGGTLTGPGRWAVKKIWSNGALDLDWELAFTPFGFGNDGAEETVALFDLYRDSSDRVLAAGSVEVTAGVRRPALARLTSAGGLDPTFDGNGLDIVSSIPAGWTSLTVRAGVFLPDGRSVFVGSCQDCPVAGVAQIYVARRLATGAPDTSFSGDGWMSFVLDEDDPDTAFARSVAVDDSGAVYIGGGTVLSISQTFFVAKVTPAGLLDLSFGNGDGSYGPLSSGLAPAVHDIAVDPNSGRIALAISQSSNSPMGGEVRVLTAAGVADDTFSGDGRVDIDLEEGSTIDGVVFQSDRKLLAVGTIDANGSQTGGFLLARLTSAGAFDSSFDGNGVKRVEFDADPDVDDRGLAAATWGGRLVAVGFAGAGGGDDQDFALVRTESALIFRDGFERGSTLGWPTL